MCFVCFFAVDVFPQKRSDFSSDNPLKDPPSKESAPNGSAPNADDATRGLFGAHK
jgi:hypothetical protein